MNQRPKPPNLQQQCATQSREQRGSNSTKYIKLEPRLNIIPDPNCKISTQIAIKHGKQRRKLQSVGNFERA